MFLPIACWLVLAATGPTTETILETTTETTAETVAGTPDPCECHCTCAPSNHAATQRYRFGGYLSVSGALDRPALALAIGARYRINPQWLTGIGVEWNPWASFDTGVIQPGSLNVYGTVIRRWKTAKSWIDLHTSLHLGTSVALYRLFGVPSGSTGLYAGLSLLGLEFRLSEQFLLIVDPADVAVAMPQVRGAPFAYRQYRLTLGLQMGG